MEEEEVTNSLRELKVAIEREGEDEREWEGRNEREREGEDEREWEGRNERERRERREGMGGEE